MNRSGQQENPQAGASSPGRGMDWEADDAAHSQAPRPGTAYVSEEERQKQRNKAVDPSSDIFRNKFQEFERRLGQNESTDSILRQSFTVWEAASLFPDAVREVRLSKPELDSRAREYRVLRQNTFIQEFDDERPLKMTMLYFGLSVAAHQQPQEARDTNEWFRSQPTESGPSVDAAGGEPLSFTAQHTERTGGNGTRSNQTFSGAHPGTPQPGQTQEAQPPRQRMNRLYGYLGTAEYYTDHLDTASQAIRQLLWIHPKYKSLKFEMLELAVSKRGSADSRVIERWKDSLPLKPNSRTWLELSNPKAATRFLVKTSEQPNFNAYLPSKNTLIGGMTRIYWAGEVFFLDQERVITTEALPVRNVSYFPLFLVYPQAGLLRGLFPLPVNRYYAAYQLALEILTGRSPNGDNHCLFGVTENGEEHDDVLVGYGFKTPRASDLQSLNPARSVHLPPFPYTAPQFFMVGELLPPLSLYLMLPGYFPPFKQARQFIVQFPQGENAEVGEEAFRKIQNLIRSALDETKVRRIQNVDLVPYCRNSAVDHLRVDPSQPSMSIGLQQAPKNPYSLGKKLKEWSERAGMIWVVPQTLKRQTLHPGWEQDHEERRRLKRDLPGMDVSLEQFKSLVREMIDQIGTCPEVYEPEVSLIYLKKERTLLPVSNYQKLDPDHVPHNHCFEITPTTTEEEWRFIRPQLTHRRIEVHIIDPAKIPKAPMQLPPWVQLVADYDPLKHPSLKLSEVEENASGEQQQRDSTGNNTQARPARNRTARQRTFAGPSSVFGAEGINIPSHGPTSQKLSGAAASTIISVSEVLTPSQQHTIGLTSHSLRDIALERTMFCPHRDCNVKHPLKDLDSMRRHVERDHRQRCSFCGQSLTGLTDLAIAVHHVMKHAKHLKLAGVILTKPEQLPPEQLHQGEPLLYPPLTKKELQDRFNGATRALARYWLRQARARQAFLTGRGPLPAHLEHPANADEQDWNRLQDFMTKASQPLVQMGIEVLTEIASKPSVPEQGTPRRNTNASLEEDTTLVNSPPAQPPPSSQHKEGQRPGPAGGGPSSQNQPGVPPERSDEPPFEVSLEHPTTYNRNGVVNNEGYRLFLEHYRGLREKYKNATLERRGGLVRLPFGALVLRNRHMGIFPNTESYRNHPTPSVFLGSFPIPLLDMFIYLCQRKIAFVQNLDHEQAVTVLPPPHVEQRAPPALVVACIDVVDVYSPIVLVAYAELAEAIREEKVQNDGRSVERYGPRVMHLEEALTTREKILRHLLPDAIVTDLEKGPRVLAEPASNTEPAPNAEPASNPRGGGYGVSYPNPEINNMNLDGAGSSESPTTSPGPESQLNTGEPESAQGPHYRQLSLDGASQSCPVETQAIGNDQRQDDHGYPEDVDESTSPQDSERENIKPSVDTNTNLRESTDATGVQARNDDEPNKRELVPRQSESVPELPIPNSIPQDVMDILLEGLSYTPHRPAPVAPMEPQRLGQNFTQEEESGEEYEFVYEESSDEEEDDDENIDMFAPDDTPEEPPDEVDTRLPMTSPRQNAKDPYPAPVKFPSDRSPGSGAKEQPTKQEDETIQPADSSSDISPFSLSANDGAKRPAPVSDESHVQVGDDVKFKPINFKSPGKADGTDTVEHGSKPAADDEAPGVPKGRSAAPSPIDAPDFLSVSPRRPASPSSEDLDAAHYRQSVLRDPDDAGAGPASPVDFVEDTPSRHPNDCLAPTQRQWNHVNQLGWRGRTVRETDRVVELWQQDLYCSRCLRKMPPASDPDSRRNTMDAHTDADKSCKVPRRIGSIYCLPNASGFITGKSIRSLKKPITGMRKDFKAQYPQYANTIYPLQAKHHNSSCWVSDPNNDDNSASWDLPWPPPRVAQGGSDGDGDNDDSPSESQFSDPGPISRKPNSAHMQRKRKREGDEPGSPSRQADESNHDVDGYGRESPERQEQKRRKIIIKMPAQNEDTHPAAIADQPYSSSTSAEDDSSASRGLIVCGIGRPSTPDSAKSQTGRKRHRRRRGKRGQRRRRQEGGVKTPSP